MSLLRLANHLPSWQGGSVPALGDGGAGAAPGGHPSSLQPQSSPGRPRGRSARGGSHCSPGTRREQ